MAPTEHRAAVRVREVISVPMNPAAAIILGIYTFIWGAWLANPFWNVFTQADLYSALYSLMPELYWGLIAMACGVFMIYGVIKSSFKSLTRGAYAGFVHWIVISGGYFLGDWHATGGITALVIAIYCGIVYLNVRVNRDNLPLETKPDNI